jgi:SAM-dependent methyltransferase
MSDAMAEPSGMSDVASFDDVNALAAVLVPARSRVLDVGCGEGTTASRLVGEGCRVWGVEPDKQRAELAEAACERVFVADIETMDLSELGDEPFDVVLCLDVLEHLVDPVQALRRLLGCLGEDGRVVASIPNVTHGSVRLTLLEGRFPYADSGMLDRGHLRFFDRRGVGQLLEQAGLVVAEQVDINRSLTETEIDVEPERWPAAVLDRLRDDPDASVYQFLVSAAASDHQPRRRRLGEQVVRTLVAQRRIIDEGAGYARRLEAQLSTGGDAAAAEAVRAEAVDGQIVELERELRVRISELETAQAEITYFERANSEHEVRLTAQRQAIANRDKQLTDARQAVLDRDKQLTDARRAVLDRDKQLTDARRAVLDRDKQLTDARRAVQDRDAKLAQTRRQVEQRMADLAERGRAAEERAAKLRRRNDELGAALRRITTRRAYRLIRAHDRWRRRFSSPGRRLRRRFGRVDRGST